MPALDFPFQFNPGCAFHQRATVSPIDFQITGRVGAVNIDHEMQCFQTLRAAQRGAPKTRLHRGRAMQEFDLAGLGRWSNRCVFDR